MPTHRHTIGQCKYGAYLCCQSNDGDYEGPGYWIGGDPNCLHMLILDPEKLTMEAAAIFAGFRKEL